MSESDARDSTSSFNIVSDVSVSRRDRFTKYLSDHIYVPAKVVAKDYRIVLGTSILLLYLLAGTVGVIFIDPPQAYEGERLLLPFESAEFPLGTDGVGRGQFSQLVHATPMILQMIAAGAVFATGMATVVGTVSGYVRGTLDDVLVLVTDVALIIPGLPLIIVLTTSFNPTNPIFVGILLTINAWAGLARTIRSEVIKIREDSYVEASQILGYPVHQIIRKDILPNLMPYILINFTMSARRVIFNSVGLYFLGLLPFTKYNWGVMLNNAVSNGALSSASTYHLIVFPTLTIVLLSYSLILISQGADKLFNPQIRARNRDEAKAQELQ